MNHSGDLGGEVDKIHGLQEALRASELRFHKIIQNSADGVLVVDWHGTIRFANPAAEKILARPAAQIVGQPFGVPLTIGQITDIDVPRGDGRPVLAEMRVTQTTWEGGPAYLATLRDVTEQRRARESLQFLATGGGQLAKSLDYPTTIRTVLRLALSHLGHWCLLDVFEGPQVVRWASAVPEPVQRQQAICQLRGPFRLEGGVAPGLQQMARSPHAVLLPQLPEQWLMSLAADGNQEKHFRAAGSEACISVPLAAHGEVLGVLTLVTCDRGRLYDQTDLELAEGFAHRAALALDNARLYDRTRDDVRRRDEFLAMLAHELRNPLGAILTGAELVEVHARRPLAELGTEDLGEITRAAELVEGQTQHLVKLLEGLLDVSRVTRGKIKLELQRLELGDVVTGVVAMIHPELSVRKQSLSVVLPPGGCPIDADPTRLGQVLSNLLINACKYTPHGGQITLAVTSSADWWEIAVQDNGQGIPPKDICRIFEPFVQVGATLDRSRGGLGIGLTLVRNLVELHGGSVTASSPGPGQGSRFVVRLRRPSDSQRPTIISAASRPQPLPAAHPAIARPSQVEMSQVEMSQASAMSSPWPSRASGSNDLGERCCWQASAAGGKISLEGCDQKEVARRIVLVEDQPANREMLCQLLELCGHTVRTASDGHVGFELICDQLPDLAIIDIGLPGVDGYEVARRVRHHPQGRRVRLVAVSGYGQARDRRQAQQAGFDEFLTKPVRLEDIQALLQEQSEPL